LSETFVVCSHCAQKNRIPEGKPIAEARCGRCREALVPTRPVAVDEALFQRHLAGTAMPVLVDVWAPWCGPCRMMAPEYEKAAARLAPDVLLLKLNADEAPATSSRFAVQSIPSLLLFRSGRLVARTAGAMMERQIVDWTQHALAAS